MRRELNLPELKFYLGSIADSEVWTHRETIWAAQEAVASAGANVFVVNAKDLPLFGNDGDYCSGIHYTTEGQITLGERFAARVIQAP